MLQEKKIAELLLRAPSKMSVQALKMKGQLEKIKKGREVFEEKKRTLDLEMARSRLNMLNIAKGLKNKEITETSMDVIAPDSPRRPEGKGYDYPCV